MLNSRFPIRKPHPFSGETPIGIYRNRAARRAVRPTERAPFFPRSSDTELNGFKTLGSTRVPRAERSVYSAITGAGEHRNSRRSIGRLLTKAAKFRISAVEIRRIPTRVLFLQNKFVRRT